MHINELNAHKIYKTNILLFYGWIHLKEWYLFFLFKTMLHCKVLFGQMVSAQSIEVGVRYPILHHAGHVTFQRERRFPQRRKADHLNLSIQTERKTTSISQMLLFIIEWLQNVLLDRYGRRARSRGGISDTNVWDQGGYYLWYFS